jgi:hypothetical protein
MLTAMNDQAGWPDRVEMLLKLVESEADFALCERAPARGDVS